MQLKRKVSNRVRRRAAKNAKKNKMARRYVDGNGKKRVLGTEFPF